MNRYGGNAARYSLIFFLVLSFSPSLGAEEAEEEPPVETADPADDASASPDIEGDESDEAIVTTTARAPMPQFATNRSIDVVDDEDIRRRQASNLGEALGEESGIYRQATNRGSDNIYMRGLIGPENLILINGVRFNQSTFRTGPNQYLATIDPWALDRVESVRGPGSVLYGSGAMGGVIQGFSRRFRDEEGAGGRLITTFKSADNTLGGALDADVRRGDYAMTAGVSHRSHHLLNPGSRGGEGVFLGAEQDGKMLGSAYRQSFARIGAKGEWSEHTELEVRYMGGLIEDARRTDQLGRAQMRSADNRDDLGWVTLTRQALGFVDELQLTGAYHRSDETTRRYQCQSETIDEIPRAIDRERCAALRSDQLLEQRILHDTVHTLGTGVTAMSDVARMLRLSYGAEAYRDHIRSSREDAVAPEFEFETADRGNFADGSTYTNAGAFVHGEWSAWHSGVREVVVNGGGRVEHFRALAPEVTDAIGDVAFDNTGFVAGLGVSYLYGTDMNLYLNWSQGFRAPNLQEATVLGDTGNFYEVPNPDLGPERNDSFELGAKLDIDDVGRLSTGLFTSLISDRITRAPTELNGQDRIDDKPVRHRINADRAYFYGAEAQFRTTSQWGLSLFGTLAWIDGAVQSEQADPNFEAGPVHSLFAGDAQWTNPRRLPPLQFLSGITYGERSDWSLTFYVEGNRAQTKLSSGDLADLRICEIEPGVLDEPGNCRGTPGWATLNLRGVYQVDEQLDLDLAITNLTDQRYQYHGSGLLGPGLQAMATMTLRR